MARWSTKCPYRHPFTRPLAVTWMESRAVGFARNSNVFLLAKWIDEGPALSYLTRACPTAGYALCAHVEELNGLTHDDLKWQRQGIAWRACQLRDDEVKTVYAIPRRDRKDHPI